MKNANENRKVSAEELIRMVERFLPDCPTERTRQAADNLLQIIYDNNNLKSWAYVLEKVDLMPLSNGHLHEVMLSVEMLLEMMIEKYRLRRAVCNISPHIKNLRGFPLSMASKCVALDYVLISKSGTTVAEVRPCHFKLYDMLTKYHKDPSSFATDTSFYVKSITAQVIWAMSHYDDNIVAADMELRFFSIFSITLMYLMGWQKLI